MGIVNLKNSVVALSPLAPHFEGKGAAGAGVPNGGRGDELIGAVEGLLRRR
jgi:hypothetical protein